MPARIAVIGSIVMDLVVRAPRFPRPGETVVGGRFAAFPGGKGANQAVAAARLGADVCLIGCVGGDDHGVTMLETLAKEGIDISAVDTALGFATGVGSITVTENGENAIVLAPGANMCVSPGLIDRAFESLRGADVVLMQLEVPLETVEHVVRRRDELRGRIVLNAAPALDVADDIMSAVDVLVVNESEAATFATKRVLATRSDDAEADIERLPIGPQSVAIVTMGARGALSLAPGRGFARHDAFAIQAVDTTGAGDAFCAALAVALAEDQARPPDFDAAIRFACAAGALACTRHGAIPSLPTRREALQLLDSR
jgi:ribokinase